MRESLTHDGETVFTDSTFPKIFGDESIFQDREKYEAIMRAIAEMLIRQAHRGWDEDDDSDSDDE